MNQKWPQVTVGDMVVASRNLDEQGANAVVGTVGVVFAPGGTYGSTYGPMVRWFNGGVCNVYEGDVEKLAGSSKVLLASLPEHMAVQRLLLYSWEDIGFNYDGLTDREQKALDRQVHERLVRWIHGPGFAAKEHK